MKYIPNSDKKTSMLAKAAVDEVNKVLADAMAFQWGSYA